MVISNSRQYIFFHIPKCGGTTITHILSEGLRWNDVVIGGTETGEARQGIADELEGCRYRKPEHRSAGIRRVDRFEVLEDDSPQILQRLPQAHGTEGDIS